MATSLHPIFCVAFSCIVLASLVICTEFRGYSYYRDLPGANRTGLDTTKPELRLNGALFRILSGTIHYFRVPNRYWEHRLQQLKANGLNTVETYVPWNLHEPLPGQFIASGDLDILKFIELASELDLFVILRPGPYICAEWEFGGLPSWLLHDENMKVRTTSGAYMSHVNRFFESLFETLGDQQFTKNGPIIAVQVENEYGSYGDSLQYMTAMQESLINHGVVEALVTSDGKGNLLAGSAPKAWITINDKEDMGSALEALQKVQSNRPLMVMEYWSGWFDHWRDSSHNGVPVDKFASELTTILSKNASVNFYVYHGGTTFGFLNGANRDSKNENYQPDVTSYDYDALVSEAGVLTEKWNRTREILNSFGLLADNLPAAPSNPPFANYGSFNVTGWLAYNHIKEAIGISKTLNGGKLLPMEALDIKKVVLPDGEEWYGQAYGFIAYETDIENKDGQLVIEEMHDRAIVIVNGQQIRVIDFTDSTRKNHTIDIGKLNINATTVHLTILVENMGRVNYANKNFTIDDQRKGLIGSVWFGGSPLIGWTAYPLEFTETEDLPRLTESPKWSTDLSNIQMPAMFQISLNVTGEPKDTFLNVSDWGRGAVFVNGHNAGRFWPGAGPQQTLYIPAPWLHEGSNTLLIFELHQSKKQVVLQDIHVLERVTAGSGMLRGSSVTGVFSLCSIGILLRFFM